MPIGKKENGTVIYLVRHAEKAKVGGRDPLLTEAGTNRANRLKDILMEAGIDAVYTTEYQRTQLTGEPTAKYFKQNIKSYNPSDLTNFAKTLKTKHKGEEILVVGHSNTTPTLVNALLEFEKYPMIDEKEYGHLFVVTVNESGTVTAMDLRY